MSDPTKPNVKPAPNTNPYGLNNPPKLTLVPDAAKTTPLNVPSDPRTTPQTTNVPVSITSKPVNVTSPSDMGGPASVQPTKPKSSAT